MKKIEENFDKKSTIIGFVVMLIVAFSMYTFELIALGKCNYGLFSIITSFMATTNLYKAIKTKDKFYIISGIIWLILAILCIVFYCQEMALELGKL